MKDRTPYKIISSFHSGAIQFEMENARGRNKALLRVWKLQRDPQKPFGCEITARPA